MGENEERHITLVSPSSIQHLVLGETHRSDDKLLVEFMKGQLPVRLKFYHLFSEDTYDIIRLDTTDVSVNDTKINSIKAEEKRIEESLAKEERLAREAKEQRLEKER